MYLFTTEANIKNQSNQLSPNNNVQVSRVRMKNRTTIEELGQRFGLQGERDKYHTGELSGLERPVEWKYEGDWKGRCERSWCAGLLEAASV